MKSENEKRKQVEKNYKLKINKVKETNKYISSFIQENSIQETNNSIINTQNKKNRNINIDEINNDFNKKRKKESAFNNDMKQTPNDINVTPITSNNSILLNNRENNSIGINGSEQSKLNEQEDYNMKEISGIMKSILEDWFYIFNLIIITNY